MNKEYKRIGQLIQELKSTGKVIFTDAEYRYYSESVTDEILENLKEIKFDSTIIAFYKQIDFIKIQWLLIENSGFDFLDEEIDIVGGSLNVPTFKFLVEMILKGNNQKIIDPDKTLSKIESASLKDYIPFDILNGDGAICFKINNGEVMNQLYFISAGLETFIKPLNITCQEYLEEGNKFYYFFGWQQVCFFENKKISKEVDFYLSQFKGLLN